MAVEDQMENKKVKTFLEIMEEDVVVDDALRKLVEEHSREIFFKKGEMLQTKGRVCRNIYFILSGKCRAYYSDAQGHTTTWYFHYNNEHSTTKNYFAVDYRSFLSEEPGNLTIEALSKIRAIQFSREGVNQMLDQSVIFERWMRKLDEKAFIRTYDRISTLLTMSATERYTNLVSVEPYLLELFSNHHIASYLGIAPQTLSRIRTEIYYKDAT